MPSRLVRGTPKMLRSFIALVALVTLTAAAAPRENMLASTAWRYGELPLMVAVLFPSPDLVTRMNEEYLVYQYDHVRIEDIDNVR